VPRYFENVCEPTKAPYASSTTSPAGSTKTATASSFPWLAAPYVIPAGHRASPVRPSNFLSQRSFRKSDPSVVLEARTRPPNASIAIFAGKYVG
jgi:hypothetical protein